MGRLGRAPNPFRPVGRRAPWVLGVCVKVSARYPGPSSVGDPGHGRQHAGTRRCYSIRAIAKAISKAEQQTAGDLQSSTRSVYYPASTQGASVGRAIGTVGLTSADIVQ